MLAEAIDNPSVIGAWWGMNFKDKVSKNVNGIEVIGSELYAKLFEKGTRETSRRNTDMIVCKDSITGESLSIHRDKFEQDDNLQGITKGKFSVQDKATGTKIFINREEYNREIHLFHKTGEARKKV